MSIRCLAAALLVATVVASRAEAGPSPADRCRMIKIDATAAHARDVLRCHTRAIGLGLAQPVPACLGAADAKLVRAFARAEKRAACPPTLATAQGTSAAFVAAVLAAAQPTPGPTPSPTPGASPGTPGCGNHVVESGEQCDGQPYCGGSCTFALPTVCCGPVGYCLEGPFPTLADICALQGVPYVLGAVCEPTDPGCSPTSGCEGTCTPEETFAATSICCQLASGCTDASITDTVQLWQFAFQGCLQAGGAAMLGTCPASGGSCVPGG